ncbi:MAG: hypothetical protein AAB373_02970 [Patescibacteria group bacterium]|mgnify:CR=1 FL=1
MNLHREFVKLSFDIFKMKNRLISLLLEIFEKEIYLKHGCADIYEYGFKYAKLSRETVEKALRTLKHVEDKPFLKQAIAKCGIHKVSLVATIATPETDKVFAEHVANMSKPALFEFAKEVRQGMKERMNAKPEGMENFGLNLFGPDLGNQPFDASVNHYGQPCRAATSSLKIELDHEMQILFFQLKHRLQKEQKRDFSNKEALKLMLKRLEQKDARAENHQKNPALAKTETSILIQKSIPGNGNVKGQIVAKQSAKSTIPQEVKNTGNAKNEMVGDRQKEAKRYVPAKQKRKILQKYENHCAYPNCTKPAENIHHRIPFAEAKSHETIIPLCQIHHEFAHNGVIGRQKQEPEEWQFEANSQKTIIDELYLAYKS